MSEEVTLLLIKMIEQQGTEIKELTGKVDELIALKNKLIASGVVLSTIFALIFDWVKDLFGRNMQ